MTNQEAIKALEGMRQESIFIVETYEKAIEALKQIIWIPCSERLPKYGVQVLTTDKDGDFELNHIIDEDDREWFWNGAIAWMPLPEPWKGGE